VYKAIFASSLGVQFTPAPLNTPLLQSLQLQIPRDGNFSCIIYLDSLGLFRAKPGSHSRRWFSL